MTKPPNIFLAERTELVKNSLNSNYYPFFPFPDTVATTKRPLPTTLRVSHRTTGRSQLLSCIAHPSDPVQTGLRLLLLQILRKSTMDRDENALGNFCIMDVIVAYYCCSHFSCSVTSQNCDKNKFILNVS
jgi:hypothetical protein